MSHQPIDHINCKYCGINQLCLPAMMAEAEVAHLDSIVKRNSPPIQKNQHLFNIGEPFHYVYAIRSGAFKSYINSYSGEQQITAFHLPGELLGLDAISSGTHNSSAVALMDSHVCKIPYEMLDELSSEIKGLRNQVMKLLSKEITDDQELLLLLGQKQAHDKMAAFLINLSSRYKARNLVHDTFTLPMSRSDLANYLGLTIETVSRVFKKFRENQLIETEKKHIRLKNINQLMLMAGINCQKQPA